MSIEVFWTTGEGIAATHYRKSCDKVPITIAYLHEELGFSGNGEDYYNHENSLLPCVLENRKGLPLTLTLLYIFVGARVGMPIYGVNLPGHFIARVRRDLFDPFHEGRILSLADCADILARQQIELSDEHLENPESRQILARLLANLVMLTRLRRPSGNREWSIAGLPS